MHNAEDCTPSLPTTKNYLTQNVNSAELGKLDSFSPEMLLSPGFRAPRRWHVLTQYSQILVASASGTCLVRHSLMFQSGLSQTHSDLLERADLPPALLPGAEDEESSPPASDHMPVPPPTSPSYFLPSYAEACAEQKGTEAPLAKAVGERSKESMSQAPAEAGRVRWSGPDRTIECFKSDGDSLCGTPRSGIQPPALVNPASPGLPCHSDHFLRNQTPQEHPWPGAWKCLRGLYIPGEETRAQNPLCATKDSLPS